MGVSFYLGRSGSGKSTAILQEIQQKLAEEPAGRPIIYLVPDQMTFQSEYQLVKSAGGMVRAQVFSFSRLAWRVLQETGGQQGITWNKQVYICCSARLLSEKKKDFLFLLNQQKQAAS